MATRFDVAAAAAWISRLLSSKDAKVTRDELRKLVLEALVERGGFDRARFYESCADVVSKGDEIVVLVAATDDPDGQPQLGLCVPGRDGPIGKDKESSDPVAQHTAADFQPHPDWLIASRLQRRTWVDVQLRVAGETVGVIAIDWAAKGKALTKNDNLLLAGVGTLVAQHLQLRPLDRLGEIRQTIAASSSAAGVDGPPLDALLSQAVPKIAHLLDTRLLALFEYKWSTGRIEKTREFDTAGQQTISNADEILVLPESYAVDQHLTGMAWEHPLYRVVPEFDRLSKRLPDLVHQESADAHTAYMRAPLLTCMYGRIDSLESRYLIRLMNRRISPLAPYAGEQHLLQAILEELRAAVDKATALGRTANLEKATREAAATADPQEMLETLAPLLDEEDVPDALFWCHGADADHISFRGTHGERLKPEKQPAFLEWKNDALYRSIVSLQNDVDVVPDATLRRAANLRSPLAQQLSLYKKTAGALIIKLIAGNTVGVMMIPLRQGSPAKARPVIDECGIGRLSLLKAYASLLTGVVDGAAARERSEGARRALAVLGHELSTPLARLGNDAEKALREIHHATVEAPPRTDQDRERRLDEAIDEVRSATNGYLNRIRAERRTTGAAMSLAPLVAQESADGHLELQMRSCNLGEIAIRALTQANQEAADQVRRPKSGSQPTKYSFRYHESLSSLGDVVGDEAFLFLAILNVMRNAYKYSTPTPRSASCRIDVAGMRQRDMKIVTVQNIGRGIEYDQADRIFEPWVRLKDDRDNTARTGMGIGLFFARRIALAHNGTVICSSSAPLNERAPDPDRSAGDAQLDRMILRAGVRSSGQRAGTPSSLAVSPDAETKSELFVTTFEIRISDKLEAGAYAHEWSPGYQAARTRRRSIS